MTRLKLLVAAAAVLSLIPASGASAADRNVTVNAGETKTWTTTATTGANVTHFWTNDDAVAPAACGKDAQNYCETVLVEMNNPVPTTDADGILRRSATLRLTEFAPVPGPVQDFDFKLYESTATGTKGAQVNTPWTTATPPDHEESYTWSVTTTRTAPTKYYYVEIIYFTSVQGSAKATLAF